MKQQSVWADGGKTWEALPLQQVSNPDLSDADDRPQVLLAVDGDGVVYRSSDGGRAWTALDQDPR